MSLTDYLDKGASLGRDAPCLVTDDRTLTYGDVVDHSHAVARALARAGVRAGDKVGILSGNDPVAFATAASEFVEFLPDRSTSWVTLTPGGASPRWRAIAARLSTCPPEHPPREWQRAFDKLGGTAQGRTAAAMAALFVSFDFLGFFPFLSFLAADLAFAAAAFAAASFARWIDSRTPCDIASRLNFTSASCDRAHV